VRGLKVNLCSRLLTQSNTALTDVKYRRVRTWRSGDFTFAYLEVDDKKVFRIQVRMYKIKQRHNTYFGSKRYLVSLSSSSS